MFALETEILTRDEHLERFAKLVDHKIWILFKDVKVLYEDEHVLLARCKSRAIL